MRLDHLLSKENIVYFCFVAGWVLVSALLVTKFLSLRGAGEHLVVASFCFQVKASAARISCVGFGSMEQRQGEAFSAGWPVGGVFGKVCLCFGLFCLVACCWVSRAARLLFY